MVTTITGIQRHVSNPTITITNAVRKSIKNKPKSYLLSGLLSLVQQCLRNADVLCIAQIKHRWMHAHRVSEAKLDTGFQCWRAYLR